MKKADKVNPIVVETIERYTQDGLPTPKNWDIYLAIQDINPTISETN